MVRIQNKGQNCSLQPLKTELEGELDLISFDRPGALSGTLRKVQSAAVQPAVWQSMLIRDIQNAAVFKKRDNAPGSGTR